MKLIKDHTTQGQINRLKSRGKSASVSLDSTVSEIGAMTARVLRFPGERVGSSEPSREIAEVLELPRAREVRARTISGMFVYSARL